MSECPKTPPRKLVHHRERSGLKLAKAGPPKACEIATQGIEGASKTTVPVTAPICGPCLYIGCSPCAGGGGGREAACQQSRASRPEAPTPKPRVPLKPVPGRGGARNRRDRLTSALSLAMASGLSEATAFARVIGLGLNRFVTIHWESGRVTDDLAATARWLKLTGDWIRSRGGQVAFIWVRETGPDKGAHVHILMHVPPDLADGFDRRQRGWQQACGALWKAKVRYSRPIGRNLLHYSSGWIDGQAYEVNLAETLDYVLKGADDAAHQSLGIRRKEPGGEVVGKRCGVSQNIGPEARRRSSGHGEDYGSRTRPRAASPRPRTAARALS
jgi:hypothetical protein